MIHQRIFRRWPGGRAMARRGARICWPPMPPCRGAAAGGSGIRAILSIAQCDAGDTRCTAIPVRRAAWNILLGLTQPLYDAGIFHADVRNAWSLFRQAALTQIQLRRQIDQQIETAYIDLQFATAAPGIAGGGSAPPRMRTTTPWRQYQQGSQIYLNVLTALNTLLTSQLQLTTEQLAAEDGLLQSPAGGGEAEPDDGAVGHAAIGTGDPRAGHAAGGDAANHHAMMGEAL